MTLDDFDAKYTEDTSLASENFPGEGRFETFGKDVQTVLDVHKHSPKRVWTAIDDDYGNLAFVAGFRYVNRIYYIITKEEYESEDEYYVMDMEVA